MMTTALALTLVMYAACFYLTLMGARAAFLILAEMCERPKNKQQFLRALRRAGL